MDREEVNPPSPLHSLFLPGRLPLLLVDLVVGVSELDLGVVGKTGGDDVQLQVLVVLLNSADTFSQTDREVKQKAEVRG